MRLNVAIVLLLAGAVVCAGEEKTMDIKIIRDDGGGVYEFSSDELEFDMFSMQVGENRAFVDRQGRNGLISRDEDGFKLEIDGETIELPDHAGMHESHRLMAGHPDIDVDVMHHKMAFAGEKEGTIIVTDKPVDEATRQSIESLLQSAGHEGSVRFIDTPATGPHVIKNVKVIKKEVH